MSGQTVISREDAKAQGLRRYFTGEPCPKNHIAERSVANNACRLCTHEYEARRYSEAPEKFTKLAAQRRAKCPEKASAASKKWRSANQQKHLDAVNDWRIKNPEKVKAIADKRNAKRRAAAALKAAAKKAANPGGTAATAARWREKNAAHLLAYQKKNLAQYAARCAKRRAAKLSACPPWLPKSAQSAIAAIYAEAKRISAETGTKHHVDHIVPLQGENVRGLHVPWNLQIIPAAINCRKFNRLLPEYAEMRVAA